MSNWRMDESELKQVIALAKLIYVPATDFQLRWQRMLEGLCDLIGAGGGVAAMFTFEGPQPRVESLAHVGKNDGARHIVQQWLDEPASDGAWGLMVDLLNAGHDSLTRTRRQLLRNAGSMEPFSGDAEIKHDCLYSVLRLRDSVAAMLCLCHPRRSKAFTPTDAKLVHLVHSEMELLYQSFHDPRLVGMTPRQRQIHEYLLKGHGEKQIAAQVGLSRHTIHAHVKAIYKHFRVTSRPELLAQFVRE